jgi:prepilin-type N-terminal cleavage/methylation domain-containing protein
MPKRSYKESTMRKVGEKGVTLMELLAVMTIIGILGALSWPRYTKWQENRRRIASLKNNPFCSLEVETSGQTIAWGEYASYIEEWLVNTACDPKSIASKCYPSLNWQQCRMEMTPAFATCMGLISKNGGVGGMIAPEGQLRRADQFLKCAIPIFNKNIHGKFDTRPPHCADIQRYYQTLNTVHHKAACEGNTDSKPSGVLF